MKKIKIRHIIAGGIVAVSIAITPYCIRTAYVFRGYKAVGGEYGLIPLGVLMGYIFIEIVNAVENAITRAKELRGESDDYR